MPAPGLPGAEKLGTLALPEQHRLGALRRGRLCATRLRGTQPTNKDSAMRAITVRDRDAGIGGLSLTDIPYPRAAENDVIVRVHAAGFTPGELSWPATWSDRAGRDRTPSVPGHELSGVVAELGYGTTGLTVGQRVFGLADWTRNGSLAEYAAVEARNLAPLPADVRPHRGRRAADLRADGLAGPVRPRPPHGRPDRPDPWLRGRCGVPVLGSCGAWPFRPGRVDVTVTYLPGGASRRVRGRARTPGPLAHSGRRRRSWQPTSAPPRVRAPRRP